MARMCQFLFSHYPLVVGGVLLSHSPTSCIQCICELCAPHALLSSLGPFRDLVSNSHETSAAMLIGTGSDSICGCGDIGC